MKRKRERERERESSFSARGASSIYSMRKLHKCQRRCGNGLYAGSYEALNINGIYWSRDSSDFSTNYHLNSVENLIEFLGSKSEELIP